MSGNIPDLAQNFMLPTSHYDSGRAERVITFVEQLRHTKGDFHGQRFILLDWQKEIVRTLFGVIKPDGYRQFRTCYIEIAKKMGKTTLAAALALYTLVADGEHGAEIYSCAADRAQASLVYREAAEFVRTCPALSKRIKILDSAKRLIYAGANSFYQVLSSEAYSKHGINPSAVFYDETHVADREMFRVMTHGASDARKEPVLFCITTAGNNPNSIGYELHLKALDIRDGRKIDPTFLPVIYAADESDDWTQPSTWAKANPSMNVTVPEDNIRIACESAKQNPSEENSFKQLRCCIWTKQHLRWMPMHAWDACDCPVFPEALYGRVCHGGLDLSSTGDITALVLVFPPNDDEDIYYVLPYFWIPEENMSLRVRRDHVPYDLWEKQGYLRTTEGNVIYYASIEKAIEELNERYNIASIAYDRWGATQVSQDLMDLGFNVIPFGQGFASMSPPTKELYTLVQQKRIAHGGNPVLRWMADNVTIRTDPAGNIKADKGKSTEKIDGIVALVMALDRAIRCGQDNSGSVYDGRGLLLI